MEKYLTTKELSERIKMAPGTIRNMVWKGIFQESVHYIKPGGRKLLFIWSGIESWLHGTSEPAPKGTDGKTGGCLIQI